MRCTFLLTRFVLGAGVMILLPAKTLAGTEVHPAAAVGAYKDAGEKTFPFRSLDGAVPFLPQFLNPIPLFLRNDCFLRILYDEHVLHPIGDALFQLIGFGEGFEVAGAAGILHPLQNPHYGGIFPMIREGWQRLSTAFGIYCFGRGNLVFLQKVGDLHRPVSRQGQVENTFHHRGRFRVDDPMSFPHRIFQIPIGWAVHVLSAGALCF